MWSWNLASDVKNHLHVVVVSEASCSSFSSTCSAWTRLFPPEVSCRIKKLHVDKTTRVSTQLRPNSTLRLKSPSSNSLTGHLPHFSVTTEIYCMSKHNRLANLSHRCILEVMKPPPPLLPHNPHPALPCAPLLFHMWSLIPWSWCDPLLCSCLTTQNFQRGGVHHFNFPPKLCFPSC